MSDSSTTRHRNAGAADATTRSVTGFLDAQQRVLDRYRVRAERRLVSPIVGRCAWFHHADLVAGLTRQFLDDHDDGGRR